MPKLTNPNKIINSLFIYTITLILPPFAFASGWPINPYGLLIGMVGMYLFAAGIIIGLITLITFIKARHLGNTQLEKQEKLKKTTKTYFKVTIVILIIAIIIYLIGIRITYGQ